ncbi:MAG: tRNA (adenosine(37)-N6)-threonylcarbamoyltransferase complex ATPase subunit type 1 TsaE [Bdellovibrionaceae bacterium]|nr:tRNA (adenosine(37)-N6)-threonylcarbamoyltransferase complex ATPase subunit type 1 TsaE [Pseudobdellovibrionaceae bacterium]MDW8190152.1 tRNA (adenosine(37)-N6)-threonylcarbamoyltransferase complex ATPase subunit type 1 TsaE [Pseudobdellovibrionaceae bacterium]
MAFLHFQGNLKQLELWIEKEFLPQIRWPALFLLEGEMGSGKTTFVQLVCQRFGYDLVTSPTFALHHVYDLPLMNYKVHHLDLFRLENEEEFRSLGVDEWINDLDTSIFIEWPKNFLLSDLRMGRSTYHLTFKILSDTEREIFVDDPLTAL